MAARRANRLDAIPRRFFTVWRFRSVDGKEVKDVARIAEPNDDRCQHEYQRVLWQGLAFTHAEALGNAASQVRQ